MHLPHKIGRDEEERRERAESSSRRFAGEESAELHERVGSSSRRLALGSPPSCSLDHDCACVGSSVYTVHLPSSDGRHYQDAHSMKRAYELQEVATSAPACTNARAALVTWRGNTCQAKHTFHYHHHYYHHEWPGGEGGPIGRGHAPLETVCCCAAVKSPHDFSAHGGPPINYPVNISALCPAPATHQFFKARPPRASSVSTSPSKRFTKQEEEEEEEEEADGDPPAAEEALRAAGEASPLTVFKARVLPLKPCSRPLPPFPSLHASPYVFCQHCARLLLLPPGTLLSSPPPATSLLQSFFYVKLKCGFCLNVSKFSTRHLHRAASSSPAEGICSAVPPPPCTQSMLCCISSNGVMQEASRCMRSEAEEPINEIFEPALEFSVVNSEGFSNGNAEHDLELERLETAAPLNGVCKHLSNDDHFHASVPSNGMYGDSTQSELVETGVLSNEKTLHTQENVVESGERLNGTSGDSAEYKHVETGAAFNGERSHSIEIVLETTECNGMCGDTTQASPPDTSALVNGKCVHPEEIGIGTMEHADGLCRAEAQPKHFEISVVMNGNCGQTTKDEDNNEKINGNCKDTPDCNEMKMEVHGNGNCKDTPDCNEMKMGVHGNGTMHDLHCDREQEITAYSFVQEWVDSHGIEIGYESDTPIESPLNCVSDCDDKLDKSSASRRRSALHRHFGYSSPAELFEKVLFSEDEEIKARTEASSTASSSFSSANACQQSENKVSSMQVHAPSLRSWDVNADRSGVIGPNEHDAQTSLTGRIKKSLKKGSLLPVSSKARVVVNGHTLSIAVIKQAEERAGKLRPGSYWYDCKAGFWGVEGGPCLGILPPYIKELNYPMTKQCSNGDTQIYVNGRELHVKDLGVLSRRGLSQKAGRAYALGFDGVLIDETTGLELKHLGKLAPTVERKGKGFGMFTADTHKQSKTPASSQIKLANSSH